MKKVCCLIGITFLLCAVTGTAFFLTTDLQGLSGVVVQKNDGNLFFVKQAWHQNTIVETDKEGNLLFQFSEPLKKGDGIRSTRDLYLDNADHLYALNETVSMSSGNVIQQEIAKLDGALTPISRFVNVYVAEGTKLDPISDFAVEDNVLYITNLSNQSRTTTVRGIPLKTDGTAVLESSVESVLLKIQRGAKTNDKYVETVLSGMELYALYASGMVQRYALSGMDEKIEGDVTSVSGMFPNEEGGVSAFGGNKIWTITPGNTPPQKVDIRNLIRLTGSKSFIGGTSGSVGTVYIGVDQNGKTSVNLLYGTDVYVIRELRVSLGAILKNTYIPIIVIVGISVIGGMGYMMLKRKNKIGGKSGFPHVKLIVPVLVSVIVLGVLFTSVSTHLFKSQLMKQQTVLGEAIHKSVLHTAESVDWSVADSAAYFELPEGQLLQQAIADGNHAQSTYETINNVFLYRDRQFHNFITDQGTILSASAGSYDEKYLQALDGCIADGQTTASVVEQKGIPCLLISSPIMGRYNNVVGVLATQLSLGELQALVDHFVTRVVLVFGLFVALIGLLLLLISRNIFDPLKRLPKLLIDIVQGSADERELRTYEKSYSSIWKALSEVNRIWLQRIYTESNLTQSYYRFVPRKIQNLLSRNSIQDVNFGDSTMIEACVSTVSVNNRESVEIKYTNDFFMAFVNRCFYLINHNLARYNGTMISGNFNLAGIRCLHEQAIDAVRYGIALHEEAQIKTDDGIEVPSLFVMIHKNNFLYGIAGSEEQAFPFMISPEVDFLSELQPAFKNAGSKLVISEEVYKEVERVYSTRSIGYVKDEAVGKAFPVYEVLNVYGERELMIYESQREKLSQAIQLFYKNDFYLARNIFSSILQECPTDGIARWYLFACDRFFNCENKDEIVYHLFGIKNDYKKSQMEGMPSDEWKLAI